MESGAGSASMEELRQRLQRMEKERGALNNTIAELQQDSSDHQLVLDAFKDLDSSRRCYRLVGGVLVERSVGEVRPALEQHKAKHVVAAAAAAVAAAATAAARISAAAAINAAAAAAEEVPG
ncbi:hypothetical protein ACSSS7_002784 [Eimeria intestinalis]